MEPEWQFGIPPGEHSVCKIVSNKTIPTTKENVLLAPILFYLYLNLNKHFLKLIILNNPID